MGKTKTTSSQFPRGYSKSRYQGIERKHFDSVESLFAEEHYGKYLVVKNNKSSRTNHNRLYLCFEDHIKFIEPKIHPGVLVVTKNLGIADTQLLSRFPEQYDFIWNELTTLIDDSMSRRIVDRLLKGFGHLLDVLNHLEITLSSLEDLDGSYLKAVENDAKNNLYSRHILGYCSQFLRLAISYYQKNLYVPELKKYGIAKSRDDDISLAVSWQCDIYACQELDEIIQCVNEYKSWMKDLAEMQASFSKEDLICHGGLFTLKNLVFTYFENLDSIGYGVHKINKVFAKAAKQLYGIELNVWKGNRDNRKDSIKNKELELRKLGDGGINITVCNERMFAIWHKVVVPEYPFDKSFLSEYLFVQNTLESWRREKARSCGFKLEIFDRRIVPDLQAIYPMYLLSLCRSGLNQQPVFDWRVWQDKNGSYRIGEDSGMGRIVDGYKGRGNTIQSTALDRQQQKYADFWCTYAGPLYQLSGDDHFFQYEVFGNIYSLDADGIRRMLMSKSHFYHRHAIFDTVLSKDGTLEQKHLTRISHGKLRKVKNLSDYLEGKKKWERQYERGHTDGNTEIIYQQTVEFQESKQHRIATTQNNLVDFFRGIQTEEHNQKFQVFTGPLSNCKNPFSPDYEGARKLRNGDVCTNWRKCLSGCSQCQPVKNVHGPNIMAWIIVMDELRQLYQDVEEWERMFLLDYMAAKAALTSCAFSDEERTICEKKANEHSRLAFMRKEVLNSQRSRRLSDEERENAYI